MREAFISGHVTLSKTCRLCSRAYAWVVQCVYIADICTYVRRGTSAVQGLVLARMAKCNLPY